LVFSLKIKKENKMRDEREKFKKEFIKRLVKFSVEIIKFSERMRKKKIPLSLIDQLIRSATSIGANVVEAKSSSSKRDYLHFFEIALKSSNETKYWLILIEDSFSDYITEVNYFLKELDEISKIIGASVLTLKGKK